jgi:hypothetical protein
MGPPGAILRIKVRALQVNPGAHPARQGVSLQSLIDPLQLMEDPLVGGCNEGREETGDARGSKRPDCLFESFRIQISIVEIDTAESIHLGVEKPWKEKALRTSRINVKTSWVRLGFKKPSSFHTDQ